MLSSKDSDVTIVTVSNPMWNGSLFDPTDTRIWVNDLKGRSIAASNWKFTVSYDKTKDPFDYSVIEDFLLIMDTIGVQVQVQ